MLDGCSFKSHTPSFTLNTCFPLSQVIGSISSRFFAVNNTGRIFFLITSLSHISLATRAAPGLTVAKIFLHFAWKSQITRFPCFTIIWASQKWLLAAGPGPWFSLHPADHSVSTQTGSLLLWQRCLHLRQKITATVPARHCCTSAWEDGKTTILHPLWSDKRKLQTKKSSALLSHKGGIRKLHTSLLQHTSSILAVSMAAKRLKLS